MSMLSQRRGDLTTDLFRPPCVAGTPAPGVLEAQCKQNVMETSETFQFFNDFQIFQVAEIPTLRFRSESSKAEGALPSFCRFVASSQIRLENLMTDLMPGPACWRDGARLSGWSCLTFHDIAFKIECNKVDGPTLPSTTPRIGFAPVVLWRSLSESWASPRCNGFFFSQNGLV